MVAEELIPVVGIHNFKLIYGLDINAISSQYTISTEGTTNE
jgi:hypothetical protein